MNCRPPGTLTWGAVMLLHAEVSRTTNPATTVLSRLRVVGSPRPTAEERAVRERAARERAAKERVEGLDTAGRILASISEGTGGSRRRAGTHR
jgi:hypothetical protein